MFTSAKVRKANEASSQRLQCAADDLKGNAHIRILLSMELSQEDRDSVWTLFEANMHALYSQSSFGWDPPNKQEELFNPLSRFVLVNSVDELMAFSMFRFEYEETKNLIYCYDLQIQQSCQRIGLGKLLMTILEKIGADWRMDKVMLTVFKANNNAREFYRASGFVTDQTCPSYAEEGNEPDDENVDYEILSKRLPRKLSRH